MTPRRYFLPGRAWLCAGRLAGVLGLVISAAWPQPAAGQTLEAGRTWRYTLLHESVLVDDCLVCGRPTIEVPLRGTFDLQLLDQNPLFARYLITNVAFATPGPNPYKVTGHGEYEYGGEVAVVQRLTLSLQIDNGWTNRACSFTNSNLGVSRFWPMILARADETESATQIQFYRLVLSAAPVTEFWFSTASGLTPGAQPQLKWVSEGDLLSMDGRVVKRNHDLSRQLAIMPVVPDLGLDGLDVLARGEIAFSIRQDIFSGTLGNLTHGDVISDQGRLIAGYAQLIGAFSPEPPPANQGLDAVQVLAGGEILFSVETNFFSETLGVTVRKGDLLSSNGTIIRPNEQLIAAFSPADPKQDYGLDAVHVWPSGEVWFSVENGFYGPHFEAYTRGDLLSDQGYVVFRNLELVGAFAPLEDVADFGLDSLFLVSDALLDSATPAPHPVRILSRGGSGDVQLEWTASGRAFQVEAAAAVHGPWLPLAPISTDRQVVDPGVTTNVAQRFYRVRQW